MNKNYLKGVRKELKVVNSARLEGKLAFRSAGSRSPIDCVIIDLEARRIKFIQCKPENYSETERQRWLAQFPFPNSVFFVSFEIL